MPVVSPDILKKARKTAGLSLEGAAKKLQLKEGRLKSFESGDVDPTRKQLIKMTAAYRRPLLTFYLKEFPTRADRGKDFRMIPGDHEAELNPDLDALLLKFCVMQRMTKAVLEDDPDYAFVHVGSHSVKDEIDAVAETIQDTIKFRVDDYRKQNTPIDAFKYIRELIENAGIFTVLMSNLGSHHTNITPSIYRGYAISDNFAPFVFINNLDSPTAQSFTALHEIVHIWINETGVSGQPRSSQNKIERFCNSVASKILLPDASELDQYKNLSTKSFNDVVQSISEFASAKHLSGTMVAYNLFRSGYIEEGLWIGLQDYYRKKWEKSRKSSSNKGGGPNYNAVKRSHLGKSLLAFIDRAIKDDQLSYTKAGVLLGMKPNGIDTLLHDRTDVIR